MSRLISVIMMVSLLGCGSNILDLRDSSSDSTKLDRNEEGIPLVNTYVKRIGAKYQLVNSYGMVLSDSYDEIAPVITGNYFWVRNGSQYGFIYKDGSLAIPIQYEQVGSFYNDRAYFKKNGRYGFLNSKGQQVIVPQYEEVQNFTSQYTWVKRAGVYGLIDLQGFEVIIPYYDNIIEFDDSGLARVGKDEKYGFVDNTGNVVVDNKYDYAFSFEEDLAVVRVNKKYGFIDTKGNEVIPIIYDGATSMSEGLAAVKQGNTYGYIDKEGNTVISFSFKKASPFHGGRAFVSRDGVKYAVIDKTGRLVTDYLYDDFLGYSDGLARVKQADRIGYIDINGRAITALEYTRGGAFNNGVAVVEKNGKCGVLSRYGKLIVDTENDLCQCVLKDVCIITRASSSYLIDRSGNQVGDTYYRIYHLDLEDYRQSAVLKTLSTPNQIDFDYIYVKGSKVISF